MSVWKTLRDFFEDLNANCKYIILRNWESLENEIPYMTGHDDVDILCENLDDFLKFTGAKQIHSFKSRNNYVVNIGETEVRFDVRFVGDGYYDTAWEEKMLKNREFTSFYYIMDKKQYEFALLYHAMLQKEKLSEEYKNILIKYHNVKLANDKLFLDVLKEYLRLNEYKATVPKDPGVVYNHNNYSYLGYSMPLFIRFERFTIRVFQKIGIIK